MSFKARSIFLLLTLIGLTFFMFSVNAFQNLEVSRSPDIIRSGWLMILTLSACVVTAGVIFFFCGMKSSCEDFKNTHVFLYVFLVIGIVLIAMSSVMLSRYPKGPATYESASSKNRTYLYIIIGMSSAIVLGCTASIVIHFRK
jgi:uncharacterized membrane protein